MEFVVIGVISGWLFPLSPSLRRSDVRIVRLYSGCDGNVAKAIQRDAVEKLLCEVQLEITVKMFQDANQTTAIHP